MSNTPAENPAIPVYVASTSAITFEPAGVEQQYFFSTNGGTDPSHCLTHASVLISGVKEIIQTESDAAWGDDLGGISNTHYTVLAVLEMVKSLIDSVQIRTGGAA